MLKKIIIHELSLSFSTFLLLFRCFYYLRIHGRTDGWMDGWMDGQGRQLNSPNDLAFSNRGDIFFTDPPYGMPQREKNPDYLGRSGVYRVRREILQAARADAEVAPEPELVEDGAFVNSGKC